MDNTIKDALDFISGKSEKVDEVEKKEDVKEVIKEEKKPTESEEVLKHTETETIKETKEESEQPLKKESTDEPPLFTDEQFWTKAKEILGKDVSSKDDLIIKEVVEKEIVKEKEYVSDFSKGYDKYFKEVGGTPQDYLLLQRDIDLLSKEQVIKETLKAENGDLTESQLSRLYNRKFAVDKDEMTDEEVEDRMLDIEIAFNKGKKFLDKQKETYTIPKDNSLSSIEAKANEQQTQVEQANKLWADTVTKENANLTGIEISLGEDFKFTHSISDEKRNAVKDIAADATLQKFYQRYQNEDGTYNAKAYQRDLYIIDNISDILKDVREHAQATQIEEDIKEDKNINFKSDGKPPVEKKYSKETEQTLDLLRHRYNLKK